MVPALLTAWTGYGSIATAQVAIQDHQIVLENNIVRRVIRTKDFVGTTSFSRTDTREEFIRTVEPEARLVINEAEYWLGGVQDVPNKAFLTEAWIARLKPAPRSLPLVNVSLSNLKSSVPHKQSGKEWNPSGKAVSLEFDHADFTAVLTFEIYDGVAGVAKHVRVQPKAGKKLTVNQIVSERLSMVESESEVEKNPNWKLPNVTIMSNLSFGGTLGTSTFWETDPGYTTQVNYQLLTPCVVEVRPPHGIHQTVEGEPIRSITSYALLHGGTEREQNTLEQRNLYRAVAPWVLDNPLMLHVVSNDDQEIRTAIDQAADCGFEMVIMSFGSGLNMEDVSEPNIARWKDHREYANRKGVRFGGYSLLASRRISDEHDVINPATGKTGGAIFGNSPCLGSKWGLEYFEKLRKFFTETGFQILEHDGNYPGDRCASETHPGHVGLKDSQWAQYTQITEFYHWCRERNIFLNVPDYYQLNGSNKTAMGYRETNWSLPREQQHVHARQNLFDGTWAKTPSMGWMFVPLVEYHGGGKEATIEPLRDHLADYEMHFANTLGYGAQACWRGTRLYDSPESKAVVLKMVNWFKEHRNLLEADVVHLRRADGRGLDYIMHVQLEPRREAMVVVYNPTGGEIKDTIELPLERFGFKKSATRFARATDKKATVLKQASVSVTVPAHSWTWIKLQSDR